MASLNRVMLMGNITRDVELKTTSGGTMVGRLSLAVNRKWAGSDGEKKEEVVFVDCEAWGKTAETMAKFLAKGRGVYLEGRLKLDQWEDKDGGKRSKLSVVVDSFQFIDAKPAEAPVGRGEAAPSRSTPPKPDDDLPF
jgi:single-strand DNA-binding protein